MNTKQTFTVLLEENYAGNYFCAYVPELRLNVVGDTEEDTLASIRDLIALKLEKSPNHKTFASKIINVDVEIPATESNNDTLAKAI